MIVFLWQNLFFFTGYLSLYALASYVVYANVVYANGVPIVVQDGVRAVGAGLEKGFYPT